MQTLHYNPSQIEIELARAILDLKPALNEKLKHVQVEDIRTELSADNPFLVLRLRDDDQDLHEVVLQLIQRPDSIIK